MCDSDDDDGSGEDGGKDGSDGPAQAIWPLLASSPSSSQGW